MRFYPFAQVKAICPMCPLPLLRSHVSAAANGVAASLPTPTPRITASVARAPVRELANA